eukprot:GSChrysophyteH1.ASY1.ANO1.1605.1 assembled CDS
MSKAQIEANIQTFLRIRPSKKPSGYVEDVDGKAIKFNLPDTREETGGHVNNSKLKHSFHFNGTIGMSATQEEVFKKVGAPAVQNALDGFNSTIFAYGQTGSGKTFTLTGGPERYFKAYVSYLELYNETGYDLLDPSHETKALEDLPKVTMLEDEHGNFHLKNLSMHEASSEEDALNLLFMGDTNRAIAETPMNMASSRSHCIFTMSIEARVVGSDTVRRSKLHLVDLAGSERVAKTNSSGSVLNEAKYINTSLFYLEMVIVALYEKATKGRVHVPYRNSAMTSVLRDSLGGNCKTVMVATINPEAVHTEESLSTCKFAQRVSLIKNTASINEDTDPNAVIKRMKGELLGLREEIAYLKGEAGEGEALTPQALEDLSHACREYVEDPDPGAILNIGSMSLTKIKDAFAVLKNLVLEARAKAAKAGSNDGNKTGSAAQLDDLKSCLLQRDNEIAILVNMVKKGKTADDVGERLSCSIDIGAAKGAAAAGAAVGGGARAARGGKEGGGLQGNAAAATATATAAAAATAATTTTATATATADDALIIKRHLFGVPPPTDRAIFEDAALSFDWFQARCSLLSSVEENREILREKIAEAKTVGEKANASRGTINYLKNSIESIRRDAALQRLDGEGKDAEPTESAEEEKHRRAIETEKAIYKESFERLRVLKPEIEHVRRILEKCRATMQSQFDQWYNNLHSRGLESFDATIADAVDEAASAVSHRQQPRVHVPSDTAEAKSVVDEDMMAFYQAKDELLRRRGNR